MDRWGDDAAFCQITLTSCFKFRNDSTKTSISKRLLLIMVFKDQNKDTAQTKAKDLAFMTKAKDLPCVLNDTLRSRENIHG